MKVPAPNSETETLVEITDVRSFILALGGPMNIARFAHGIGWSIKAERIKSWSYRGSIPVVSWPPLIAMADALGLDGVNADFMLALMQRTKKLKQQTVVGASSAKFLETQ
jgi:hypothetical protein